MDPTLLRLADAVTTARGLEAMAGALLDVAIEATGMDSAFLATAEAGGARHVVLARNPGRLDIAEGTVITPMPSPTLGVVAEAARDAGLPPCWGDRAAARALGVASDFAAAVETDDGEPYGLVGVAGASAMPLSLDAARVLALCARLIGQQVGRERLQAHLQLANARLSASSLVDPVTALPNRRALFEEFARMLARARRDGMAVVVAVLDLDGFRRVNEAHGHEAGDQLLASVGQRVSASRRAGDLVARLGGDVFVVVAPVARAVAEQAVATIHASLLAATSGHFRVCGVDIDYAGASVGAVVSDPGAASPQALVSQADAAMRIAKRERASSPA